MRLDRVLLLAIPVLLGVVAVVGFLVPGLPRGVELSTLTALIALITGVSSVVYERRVRRAAERLGKFWTGRRPTGIRVGAFSVAASRQQAELDFDNVVVRELDLMGADLAG